MVLVSGLRLSFGKSWSVASVKTPPGLTAPAEPDGRRRGARSAVSSASARGRPEARAEQAGPQAGDRAGLQELPARQPAPEDAFLVTPCLHAVPPCVSILYGEPAGASCRLGPLESGRPARAKEPAGPPRIVRIFVVAVAPCRATMPAAYSALLMRSRPLRMCARRAASQASGSRVRSAATMWR